MGTPQGRSFPLSIRSYRCPRAPRNSSGRHTEGPRLSRSGLFKPNMCRKGSENDWQQTAPFLGSAHEFLCRVAHRSKEKETQRPQRHPVAKHLISTPAPVRELLVGKFQDEKTVARILSSWYFLFDLRSKQSTNTIGPFPKNKTIDKKHTKTMQWETRIDGEDGDAVGKRATPFRCFEQ